MTNPAFQVRNLSKSFDGRSVLRAINIDIQKGEIVALLGSSGSGKSTLLRCMAGLLSADRNSGPLEAAGQLVQSKGKIATDIRQTRRRIGFVFQHYNLVDVLPLQTNVMLGALGRMPQWRILMGFFLSSEIKAAREALSFVGLAECEDRRTGHLSGGQQQRAAIARALVQGADILIADEPVASLDPRTATQILEILQGLNQQQQTTIVMTLHHIDYALKYANRILVLKDGHIVLDAPVKNITPAILQSYYQEEYT